MSNRQKDFIAEIKTQGLSRMNRFTVEMTPPVGMPADIRRTLLFCEKASLPGISFSTTQNRTFGEFREVPYDRLFDTIQLTFHVDKKMTVKKIFDDWTGMIQNPGNRSFGWYNEYVTPITIRIQDLEDKVHYEVTCFEAYPKTIGQVSLDAEGKDTMRLEVTFQYKYWTASPIYEAPNGQLLNADGLKQYTNDFTGFQARFNKGLGEAGNFLTGAVGQVAMRGMSSVSNRIANSSFMQKATKAFIKMPF